MSAAKHSPGPWVVGAYGRVMTLDGETLRTCGVATPGADSDEYRANTRLIAAAPELLNELINLTARFKAAVMQAGTDEEFAELAVASARAAIAKAEVQS